MKEKIFLILIIVGILISGCANIPIDKEVKKEFLVYEDSNMYILYPSNWVNQEQVVDTNKFITFVSPKEDSLDNFKENLHVGIYDISKEPITLKERMEKSLANLKSNNENSEMLEPILITLDNNPAYKFSYKKKKQQLLFTTKILQVITIKNDKLYVLTFGSEESKYDNYDITFQKMIGSFKLI